MLVSFAPSPIGGEPSQLDPWRSIEHDFRSSIRYAGHAMADGVNIFKVARDGHLGEENQLIELFAFLLQQQPELVPMWLASVDESLGLQAPWAVSTQHVLPTKRRPDLLLERLGEAVILVEVKLDSGEGMNQLADYAHHLRTERGEPLRALIYLAKDDVAAMASAGHTTPEVPVFPATWQRFQGLLQSGGVESTLARDFADMLERRTS